MRPRRFNNPISLAPTLPPSRPPPLEAGRAEGGRRVRGSRKRDRADPRVRAMKHRHVLVASITLSLPHPPSRPPSRPPSHPPTLLPTVSPSFPTLPPSRPPPLTPAPAPYRCTRRPSVARPRRRPTDGLAAQSAQRRTSARRPSDPPGPLQPHVQPAFSQPRPKPCCEPFWSVCMRNAPPRRSNGACCAEAAFPATP